MVVYDESNVSKCPGACHDCCVYVEYHLKAVVDLYAKVILGVGGFDRGIQPTCYVEGDITVVVWDESNESKCPDACHHCCVYVEYHLEVVVKLCVKVIQSGEAFNGGVFVYCCCREVLQVPFCFWYKEAIFSEELNEAVFLELV